MTRRKRLGFVSRACIGMFLLLFGEIAADTTNEPQTLLRKNFEGATDKQAPLPTNETFAGKNLLESNGTKLVSSPSFASASLNSASPSAPEEVERENVGDRTDRDAEREKTAEDYVAAKRTGPDQENVPTSPSPLNVASTDHDLLSDKSSLRSTMDSIPKRFKLDNLRENVDKGSSANAASKESTRLSKMNNLDTATASEVSTLKHGDKINGTVRVSEFAQSDVHHELFNEEKTNSEDPVQEARDSEQFNLENAGKTEDVEGGISLLNDTRVNYGHPRENRTGGSANSGKEETDSSTENPKGEIELIKNISRSPLLKLILKSNGTSPDKNHAQTNGTVENELEDKGGPEVSEMRQKPVHSANLNASTDSDKDSSASAKSEVFRKETQAVSQKAKDDLNDGRGIVLTTMSNPSLLPKGRTIAFSGVNEFSSNEDKTSPFAGSSKDTVNGHDYRDKSSEVPSKKNTSGEKVDQKSYPYVKSTKTLPQEHTERSFGVSGTEHSDTSESTSEESLAYENTISRRQESETKFVVTEPSVVIENSIQQFKSTYDKRSGNASGTEFTVKSQSFAGVTPTSSATLDKDAIANGTLDDEKKSTGLVFENARTTNVEDAPRRTDIIGKQKEITGKEENFDVTGNGITEISPKLNEPSYGPSFFPDETLNSTTVTSTLSNFTKPTDNVEMSTNVDVQTDAEESLLLRSTLNVTETSTEYPLLKANSTEDTRSTTTTVNPSTNSITFATLNDTTPPTLVTSPTFTTTFAITSMTSNETSNDTTRMSDTIWSFNESSTPTTTTTIEYEFVGLTETVDQITENVTTDKTPAAIDDHTENYTTPTSTVPPLSVGDITTIVYPTSLKATLETNSEDTTTTFPSTTEMETTVDDKTIFTIPEDQILENETTLHSTLRSVSPSIIDDRSNSTKDFVGNVNSTDSDSSTTVEINTAHPSEAANSNVSASSEAPSTLLIDTSSFPSTDISLVPSDSHDTYHPNMVTTSNTTQSSFGADVTTRSTAHFPFVPSTLRPRILQSTWSSSSGGPVLAPTGKTVENNQGPLPDNVPLLVRIVIEGSLSEVCPHLQKLAQFLVDMLNTEVDKPVSDKQVIFHQNPCTEPQNPAPTSTDMSFTSILVYIVDEEGKFDMAKTKMLPNLYKGTPINIPVTIRSFLLVQDSPDSGNAIAVVIVCSVAFICLVLLASLLFIMRKRQTRFNYGERCRPVSLDAYSLDSVSAYNSVRRKGVARSSKRSYGNPTFEDSSAIPSHPLNFAGLSSFHTDVNAINEEFSSIPQVWAKIDELPAGAEVKNRYANVIPLPETRVPLQRVNNDPLSEYINANYVRGPKNATKYYIACQAPMEATVTDFWRMIWEQQSKVIIMLTDFVENGIDKCTEYIPPSEVTDCHRLYGDFQVTLKKRETKEKYAISTLHLKNLENNTFREVFHIWYLWPVNGVQSDGTGLIAILLEARALQRGGPGPIVVHCSPGTGRTGTLIALDLGIRQYEITRTVDVPRVVCTIRRDRAGAVQTKEQYAFIYKALNLYATKLAGGVLEST